MSPRARKVWADLFHNKARSALVVLSMSTGVFAVGLVAGTRQTGEDVRSQNGAQHTCPGQQLLLWVSRAGGEGQQGAPAAMLQPLGRMKADVSHARWRCETGCTRGVD